MKRTIISLLLCCTAAVMFAGCDCRFTGVKKLADRQVPWLSENLKFEKIEADKETFTLRAEGDNLIVGATNANAAAVGVNWYLKYFCHRCMSHMGDNLEPTAGLLLPAEPVMRSTDFTYRHALNYCTFNYTMSFHTWEEWERELDWMALNGVNMMLVANGSEAVWRNTLRRLGYSDGEIAGFIAGPSYNAWWLMGNLEGWGGPMPQSQIEDRAKTVRKMLVRMKELGIEPVMPGFYGMVPGNFGDKTSAKVIPQGTWGAFTRPAILDPADPEFARVAAIFYEETKKLYGNDIRFFSGDPFHEGGVTSGIELGDAGAAIQKEMQRHFPGSTWVLQAWQDNPKPQLLEKLDKRHVLVQDLFGENTDSLNTRHYGESTPFIWCTVTNFGERSGLNGKLQLFADEVHRASGSEYMKGVGVLAEGLGNNPVAYELLLELAWHDANIDVSNWLERYIVARYGKPDADISAAWQIFLRTIYSSDTGYQEGAPENILCARPACEIKSVSGWGRLEKKYDVEEFRKGVALFAGARDRFRPVETYRIDLINFLRQVIANDADAVFEDVAAACNSKDRSGFESASARFLRLHDIENELLAQEPHFRVSSYQKAALAAGNTPEEKDNNLLNAMMLVTYWGENNPAEDYLHDYAYKEWAGMMNSYYKERWITWFDYLGKELAGEPVEKPSYFFWEREWAENNRKLISDSPEMTIEEVLAEIGI